MTYTWMLCGDDPIFHLWCGETIVGAIHITDDAFYPPDEDEKEAKIIAGVVPPDYYDEETSWLDCSAEGRLFSGTWDREGKAQDVKHYIEQSGAPPAQD